MVNPPAAAAAAAAAGVGGNTGAIGAGMKPAGGGKDGGRGGGGGGREFGGMGNGRQINSGWNPTHWFCCCYYYLCCYMGSSGGAHGGDTGTAYAINKQTGFNKKPTWYESTSSAVCGAVGCRCFFRPNTVVPIRPCGMCFEDGAKKRICCNAMFCDHCYTKDKCCPNCGTTTKQEKLTGATYTLPLYSEHEECRVCLEPGLKRPCCSNYYCDECFYSSKTCRACGTPIGDKHIRRLFRGINISIMFGWAFTIFTIIVAVVCVAVVVANVIETPETLSGYKCNGFFRSCDLNVCVDMPQSVANGSESLPPLSRWTYCDLDSYAKLEAQACVFDKQLYAATDGMMGYDICKSSFQPGVYVFEDGFENWENSTWQSNQMKSARWASIINGDAANYCGACSGKKALVFTGGLVVQQRYAETQDVELSTGGWIEYDLLISPGGWDVTRPRCPTNYKGDVFTQYSVDGGSSWNSMNFYKSASYRSEHFFHDKFEIKFSAPKIRFRFYEPLFSVSEDAWALDNVRVFRNQPSGWASEGDYMKNVATAQKEEEQAQCCFDTDACGTRLSEHAMSKCGAALPWYQAKHFQMRDAEVVILLVVFVNLLKFLYVSGKDLLVRKRFPFEDEFDDITHIDWIMRHVPVRFHPKKLQRSNFVANIHHLARLGSEAKKNLSDLDGVGERIKQQAELAEEKEAKRVERMERLKKKIEKREQYLKMKTNRYAKQAAAELQKEIDTDVDEVEEAKQVEVDHTKFGTGIMTTDVDKIKRSEMSMLRVAFDLKFSNERYIFAGALLGSFVILIIALISVTKYYVVSKTLSPFNAYTSELTVTSFGFNFLAIVCDWKEIFWTLKFAVPVLREKSRLDMITIDRSDETNSLFVGPYTIPMEEILSVNPFTRAFALAVGVAYFLGAFPWNVLSLILRNAYLEYQSMLVVTPIFGAITILRAILGPGIFVKIAFACSFYYSCDKGKRELIGIACQATRTRLAALHGALVFTLLAVLIVAAFAAGFIGQAVATAFVCGAMYGGFTLITHNLPVHPYMQFTTFNQGVYLVLKRKEKCPCVYWGAYCTDMHEMQEMFLVYTTWDSRLVELVKKGNSNLY
jgi:hypothetical protein